MKHLLLSILSLLCLEHYSFSQEELFEETEKNISNYFKASEEIFEERYGDFSRSEKLIVNSVVLKGSDFVNQLHRSGSVVFSGGAVEYLNNIKSYLLEDYSELDELIEVFVTIDPSPNAFATVNNNVYVNTGLLELVESEAQLAYILCHEIMHIINEHLINKELQKNSGNESMTAQDVALKTKLEEVSKHNLSQLLEFESDIDGFTLFNRSDYDNQASINSLIALKTYGIKEQSINVNGAFFAFSNEVYDSIQEVLRAKDEKFRDATSSSSTVYQTHPDIDERIDTLTHLVQSGRNKTKKSIISESEFNKVKKQAIRINETTFARDKDFVSLFILEATKRGDNNLRTDKDFNLFCYSLQGLVFDKLNERAYEYSWSKNHLDSTLTAFYNTSSNSELIQWALNLLNEVGSLYDVENYRMAIQGFAFHHLRKSELEELFGENYSSLKNVYDDLYTDNLQLKEIPFSISPHSDMSSWKAKKFNTSKRSAEPTQQKILLANSNIATIRVKKLAGSSEYDAHRSSKLYNRLSKVFENLEEDHANVTDLIPKSAEYSSETFVDYKLVNNWLNEQLYFDQRFFVSYQQDELDKLRKTHDARYALFTLNFEIKSFSGKSFIVVYFGPFVVPHYLPQSIAYVANSSARSYNLTLIFDLEDGGIAYWDKRTYLEPNSVAQLNQIYDDILKQFYD